MRNNSKVQVAIIDIGIGNLMSIGQAFHHAACDYLITRDHKDLMNADAVVLPGVGAFNDAMKGLNKYDLVQPLKEIAQSNKYLIGICLGMQLLFSESSEFGISKGLNILEGEVVKFPTKKNGQHYLAKVPQVGWNNVTRPDNGRYASSWDKTPMEGLAENDIMYFMHSFYVKPAEKEMQLTHTEYAGIKYCSSVYQDNIIAMQFHPERSGKQGLKIYKNLAEMIKKTVKYKL
tara:strand:+ start:753 stop:1448 length:696 start_codon:yes stop_codon:yes gene_type:complete